MARPLGPLVFGFLPVGLAYHAAYCVVVALLMWTVTRVAWPAHLYGRTSTLIPGLLVFAYLTLVLYIGIFAFLPLALCERGRGLFPGRPVARLSGVPAVAVRHQHDRFHDPLHWPATPSPTVS